MFARKKHIARSYVAKGSVRSALLTQKAIQARAAENMRCRTCMDAMGRALRRRLDPTSPLGLSEVSGRALHMAEALYLWRMQFSATVELSSRKLSLAYGFSQKSIFWEVREEAPLQSMASLLAWKMRAEFSDAFLPEGSGIGSLRLEPSSFGARVSGNIILDIHLLGGRLHSSPSHGSSIRKMPHFASQKNFSCITRSATSSRSRSWLSP